MRTVCSVEGCLSAVTARGLCHKHYMRQRRKGSTDDARSNQRGICSVEGCDRPHQARGRCHDHWKRLRASEKRAAELRLCARCGAAVDPERRRRGNVSYCSRTCKERAYVEDGRQAVVSRRSYFKRLYGLSLEECERMASAGCAICGTTDWPGRHNRPHIDHCHATGRVRGVLCSECNTGLGKFRDDPVLLARATAYLSR